MVKSIPTATQTENTNLIELAENESYLLAVGWKPGSELKQTFRQIASLSGVKR